jgi:hypothetical protein
MIELAIGLPLFLGFLFASYWAVLYYNARTALHSAVPQAIQIAQTRGNISKMGSPFLIPLDCFYYLRPGSENLYVESFDSDLCAEYDDQNPSWNSVGEALYYNNAIIEGDTATDPEAALALYDSLGSFCDEYTTIEELPRYFIYTLAFINSIMKKSIGPSLRYPCDPRTPDGENCLLCEFSHPDWILAQSGISCSDGFMAKDNQPGMAIERMTLTCRYRPSTSLINLLLSSIGFSSSQFGLITVEGHN